MNIEPSHISGVDHVGLPSYKSDWSEIQTFWESLGLEVRTSHVDDDSYDHAGAGSRLQFFAGTRLVVSYYTLIEHVSTIQKQRQVIEAVMGAMHFALKTEPPALKAARVHQAFERETHWGMSNTSVFLTGPYGLHVELVTTDPDFHAHD
jgi:hypothetical protein